MLMIWKETPFHYSFPLTVLYYLSNHSSRVPWLLDVTKRKSLTLITKAEESCPVISRCLPETASESAGWSLNFCFPCTSFSSFGPLYPDVSCSCASLLSEGDTASGNLHAGRTATREVRKLDYHVLLIIFRGSDGAWWFALVPIPPPRHTWNDSGPTPDRWRPGFIHQALTHCGTDNSILQKVSCF